VVLGSIRPGEDDILFPAMQQILEKHPQFRFIVAPRHREKFDLLAAKLDLFKLPFVRWSSGGLPTESPIVLLDTLGQLTRAYAPADLVFIGGSIVPIGGHNPMEAAAYGCPIAMGPHYFVYRDVVDQLANEQAFFLVQTTADFFHLLEKLVTVPADMKAAGARGRAIWQSNHGATQRILKIVSGEGRP
jgi:3-deoxy-D-manno-octulosonic-acid transferase